MWRSITSCSLSMLCNTGVEFKQDSIDFYFLAICLNSLYGWFLIENKHFQRAIYVIYFRHLSSDGLTLIWSACFHWLWKPSCRNLPLLYLELADVYRKKCQNFKYILPLVEDWLSIKDEIRFPQMPEDWNTRKNTPKYWLIMSFAFFPAFSAYEVPAMVR